MIFLNKIIKIFRALLSQLIYSFLKNIKKINIPLYFFSVDIRKNNLHKCRKEILSISNVNPSEYN